jgi:DNA-directed RNA polymerase subunit M/transcription elongation factor TFIIS|tara:strand:- start:316 stop:765 length:450 start_codon:yes stop_codon:yes gene_type:complete
MVIYFKSCPRDQGDIFLNNDIEGYYLQCLQCGYMKDVEKPSEFYVQKTFLTTPHKITNQAEEDFAIDGRVKMILKDLDNRKFPVTLSGIQRTTRLSKEMLESYIDDITQYGLANVDYGNNGADRYSISVKGQEVINCNGKTNKTMEEDK